MAMIQQSKDVDTDLDTVMQEIRLNLQRNRAAGSGLDKVRLAGNPSSILELSRPTLVQASPPVPHSTPVKAPSRTHEGVPPVGGGEDPTSRRAVAHPAGECRSSAGDPEGLALHRLRRRRHQRSVLRRAPGRRGRPAGAAGEGGAGAAGGVARQGRQPHRQHLLRQPHPQGFPPLHPSIPPPPRPAPLSARLADARRACRRSRGRGRRLRARPQAAARRWRRRARLRSARWATRASSR